MEKLKQDIKNSGRYEYDNPRISSDCNYQSFRDHNSDCELLFVEKKWSPNSDGSDKQKSEEIEICFPLEKNCPESGCVAVIHQELSLEELEKIIEIFKLIEDSK